MKNSSFIYAESVSVIKILQNAVEFFSRLTTPFFYLVNYGKIET